MTLEQRATDVLLVVPTLGRRPEYLRQTLESIRAQSIPADIVVVAPVDVPWLTDFAHEFDAKLVPDPGSLTEAINLGIEYGVRHHTYVNWLNDDDLLETDSLSMTTAALDSHPEAVVAYGDCRYIDAQGRELWVSRAGRWAPRILKWGPDLVPQPGMLIRADAWRRVGGLDVSYRLAFDLDLLLRLQRLGPLIHAGAVVSSFRWHPDSLTVDDRGTNLDESERAKRSALTPFARRLTWIWERPVRLATRMAARQVSRRAGDSRTS